MVVAAQPADHGGPGDPQAALGRQEPVAGVDGRAVPAHAQHPVPVRVDLGRGVAREPVARERARRSSSTAAASKPSAGWSAQKRRARSSHRPTVDAAAWTPCASSSQRASSARLAPARRSAASSGPWRSSFDRRGVAALGIPSPERGEAPVVRASVVSVRTRRMPSASFEADGLAAARGIGPAADGLVVSRLAPCCVLTDTAGTVLAVGGCFAVSATADARRHPVHARGIAARDVDAEARGLWPQRCDAGTVRQDFADGPPEAWAASLRAVAGSLRRPCGLRERRGRPLVAACRSGWPAFAGLRNARPVRGLRGCRRREALDRSPRVPRRARHNAHVAAFPGERAGVVEPTPVPGRPFSPSPVSPLSVTRTGNPVQRCLRNGGLWYAGNCGENDGGAQGVRGGPLRNPILQLGLPGWDKPALLLLKPFLQTRFQQRHAARLNSPDSIIALNPRQCHVDHLEHHGSIDHGY